MNKLDSKQNLIHPLVRPPVVTVMGHVDHGKTTLLDSIRNTHVTEKEHGGITQHIGAYQISYKGQTITFIDTPGHAAFSQMRARGAKVTDLVILVIAADDGVMPQTKESLSHIKASGVPFIVAVNKIDLPGADINKVKQQLADNGVLVEGYGGDIVLVPVSAKTKEGLDDLLEMVILVSQMIGLKDESKKEFLGVIIESSLDRFRGPVATVLVQSGVLKVGDQLTAGKVTCKVKSLKTSEGKIVKEVSISTPVEVLGFKIVPNVGEVVSLFKEHQEVPSEEEKTSGVQINLPSDKKEFRLIIKADVGGSLEALTQTIEQKGSPDSKITILHKETGDINESDIYLAGSTKALVLGFNVKISSSANKLAEDEKVPVKLYNVIYELLDDLQLGIDALTKKEEEKKLKGKARVLALFETTSGKVAGAKVLEGDFNRGDTIVLLKNDQITSSAKIVTMKHLKEDINKAVSGQEFGMITNPESNFTAGDIIVTYK